MINRKFLFLMLSFWLGFAMPYGWANINDGLIGHWPLNGDALDYSGKENNGTVLPRASFVQNPTGDGLVLQNVGMDLNEGHVRVDLKGDYHPKDGTADFKGSGSFWVMFDDKIPTPTREITQEVLAHMPGIAHVYRENSSKRKWMQTMVRRIDSEGALKNTWPVSSFECVKNDGVWYHVVWTFHSNYEGKDGHFRWYINGKLNTGYDSTGLLAYGTKVFRIGGSNNGYGCNAKVAQVRLYDRILTAEEVLELSRQKHFSPVGHYPAWWWNYGIITDEVQIDDYAAVNQGQLKYVATQTASYLESVLEPLGGVGESIQILVDGWNNPSSETDNYAAINAGQLKYVATLFYHRLKAVTFAAWPESFQIDPGTGYPWPAPNAEAPVDEYVLANVGQLKYLFSFDLSGFDVYAVDSDGNGLADWWEYLYTGQAGMDVDADPDEDGLTNLQEWLSGGNPLSGDSNGDGVSDMSRYLAGLNLSQRSAGEGLCILSILE